jgi:hypothetical protein
MIGPILRPLQSRPHDDQVFLGQRRVALSNNCPAGQRPMVDPEIMPAVDQGAVGRIVGAHGHDAAIRRVQRHIGETEPHRVHDIRAAVIELPINEHRNAAILSRRIQRDIEAGVIWNRVADASAGAGFLRQRDRLGNGRAAEEEGESESEAK